MNDEQGKPRKILLGKKVIRHFAVRSGIQTGVVNNTSTTDTDPGGSSGQADPSNNTSTNNTCSANTSTNTNCVNQTVIGTIKATGLRC